MKYIVLFFIIPISLLSCRNLEDVSGKWELYNNQFILTDNLSIKPDSTIILPGNFKDTIDNDIFYGSIKKRIKVRPNNNYTFYISGINSASKIWVDGDLKGEYGVIGKKIDDVTPLVKPTLVNFKSKVHYVDIVIEFSNFHLREDLLFRWIILDDSIKVLRSYLKDQSRDYFLAGILFIVSILFFLLYVTNRRCKYNLYFSLFSLSYGVRSFLMEKVSIHYLFPLPWEYIYKITKSSELLALAFILLFFKELYPKELKTKITNFLVFLSFLFSVTPFLPLELFSGYKMMFVFHFLVFITGNYFLMRLFLAFRRKRILSKLAFISLIIFSLSTTIDILSNRYIIRIGYVSAQAVVLLVVTMCIMVAKKRTVSITEVKSKKSKNVKYRNAFSRFVPLDILSMLGNEKLEDRPPGDSLVTPQTVAYIDIRDFTKLSLGLTPEENFILINNFFKLVGDEVTKNNGFIESYGGDGVKVIFPMSPDSAIKAALSISQRVSKSQNIKIGISIHLGNVVMGTIGSDARIQATTYSHVTRVINKIDFFNSKMGTELVVSENVICLLEDRSINTLFLGNVLLKGEEQTLGLYQIFPKEHVVDQHFKTAFENGINMIQQKRLSRAYGYFELALRYNSQHRLTENYLEQLEKILKIKQANFTLTL